MTSYLAEKPSLEDYWRGIILFGKNVACYKFALAKSLLEFAPKGKSIITLEDLAEPFSRHITEHLRIVDKQITSPSSRFLDACRKFNAGELRKEQLVDTTVRLGFENVIDAFHNVGAGEIPKRFFSDERRSTHKGIILTDDLLQLVEQYQYRNLPNEVEARWRLVETAWELNISRNLIAVNYDEDKQLLFTEGNYHRRVDVTSCRSALNAYQKGRCFYCFTNISIISGAQDLAEVDHFFAHSLAVHKIAHPINGIWNLVLACQKCNQSKSNRLPHKRYLERLFKRNERLIKSPSQYKLSHQNHHPLRQALIRQTGENLNARASFLNKNYLDAAFGPLINSSWEPENQYSRSLGENEL